jgi:hypothetical protein
MLNCCFVAVAAGVDRRGRIRLRLRLRLREEGEKVNRLQERR